MLLFFLISYSLARKGVDFSMLLSKNTQECLKDNGYVFAIPRCWRSVGNMDTNCVQNCVNAHAAGMSRVDTYFFPCYSCGNIGGQVNTFWNNVIANKMDFTTLWFDIEGSWSSSYTTNQQFLNDMIEKARSIGIVYGIYSSQYYWGLFFGSNYKFKYASTIPVWYAHYDNNPSFSDWSKYSFGGWSEPTIKQYKGDTTLCSASIDFNYEK